MNTAKNGRNIKNSTHSVLVTPDTEWSRNRSLKIWNKTMSQMNRKKNHSTDQKMSPNETSATITVSSLDGWAERNKHRGRGADSAVATHPERVTTGPGSDWFAQVAAVGGHGPDDEDVQGDDQQRPERVVGDEQEVGDRAEHGQGDGRGPGPGPARQQSPAGEGHHQPDQQVDPAPGGGVELEGVVAGGHIELVLEDGDQALQGLKDTRHDHHDRGEQDEPDRRAARLPACSRVRVVAHCRSLLDHNG